MLGLYVHIPFCLSKCGYCAFVSRPAGCEEMQDYCAALCREIGAEQGGSAATVYIGGGTPTALPRGQLGIILQALRTKYSFCLDAEISVEANPDTVDRLKAAELRATGVNRVSLGLQSADDALLRRIGRRHDCRGFLRAVDCLRAEGFDNLSADLMLGLPSQTIDSAVTSARLLVDCGFKHVSAYAYEPEEGTPLFSEGAQDQDLCTDMYDAVRCELKKGGLERYEVSNFAIPRYECRHNIGYWRRTPYRGFGAAAHSLVDNVRRANTRDIGEYIRSGACPIEERLTDEDIALEYVMLGLRMREGVEANRLKNKNSEVEDFIAQGLMERGDGRVWLSDKGFYVMNSILCKLC